MQKHQQNLQPLKSQLLLQQNNFDSILLENTFSKEVREVELMLEEYEQYFSETLLERSIIDIGADAISNKVVKTRDSLWSKTKKFLGLTFKRMFFAALAKTGNQYGKRKHEAIKEGRALYKRFNELYLETFKASNELYSVVNSSKIFGKEDAKDQINDIFNPVDPPSIKQYQKFINELIRDVPEFREIASLLNTLYEQRMKGLEELKGITLRIKSHILKPAGVDSDILDKKYLELLTFGLADSSSSTSSSKGGAGDPNKKPFNPARAMTTNNPRDLNAQEVHEVVQHIRRLLDQQKGNRGLQNKLDRWLAYLDDKQHRMG